MNGPLTVGSLFSGIGGFDLGLERAGMSTAWFCEQDDYCRRVLNRHWPGVPVYPDVTTLTAEDVEPVEVLCGGFPCQDLSLAGKGAGIDGARSGLWSEFARLIGELRPRYVIVENVPALLSRGIWRVTADLAALGYDTEWDCLPASAFGAPHRRDRVWIVAYPGGEPGRVAEHRDRGPGREPAFASESAVVRQEDGSGGSEGSAACDPARHVADPASQSEREPADETVPVAVGGQARNESRRSGEPAVDRRGLVHNTDSGRHGVSPDEVRPGREAVIGAGWWEVEPDVGRVADGIPARMDRLKCLGNALVPQIAEWIGKRIVAYEQAQTNRRELLASLDPKGKEDGK